MDNGLIYSKISNIMKEISAISKNKKNQQQNFMYRGIDDVMNTLKPLLSENGVFVVPEVLENTREDRVTNKGNNIIYSIMKVKHTFYAEDGSHIESIVVGEGMDSGDKASNKAMAIAYKYSCFQVFCIPTEEMVDPDSECHSVQGKNTKQGKPQQQAKPQQQVNPSQANEVPSTEDKIDVPHIRTIQSELERTGIKESVVLGLYKVDKLEDINYKQFDSIMKKFKVTPDKKSE